VSTTANAGRGCPPAAAVTATVSSTVPPKRDTYDSMWYGPTVARTTRVPPCAPAALGRQASNAPTRAKAIQPRSPGSRILPSHGGVVSRCVAPLPPLACSLFPVPCPLSAILLALLGHLAQVVDDRLDLLGRELVLPRGHRRARDAVADPVAQLLVGV